MVKARYGMLVALPSRGHLDEIAVDLEAATDVLFGGLANPTSGNSGLEASDNSAISANDGVRCLW